MYRFIFYFVIVCLLFSCEKQVRKPNVYIDRTATVGTLDCSGAEVSGRIFIGEEVNYVSVKIPYTEGNGKMYNSQYVSSTNVTGLTASLLSDSLAVGSGSVVFRISGTPSSSGRAQFDISLGGKSCSFNINVEENKPTSGYGPNINDVDGNTYKTAYIGTQHWMAENLKTSKYNDGSPILNLKKDAEWNVNKTGAWRYYNNDSNNNAKYGKLYNWYTTNPVLNGNKNVCPSGWHVPSDKEWIVLSEFIGNDGGKLKAVGSEWQSPNTGATNSTLFTALPAGYTPGGLGTTGYWWSTKEVDNNLAHNRGMLYINTAFYSNNDKSKQLGCSIRCLKD